MAKRSKTFRFRLWVDIDGEKFFGPGRAELLQHIGESGSISKAAKAMGMSYKKAWLMVSEMNERGHAPYVIPKTGGDKGGGAELTKAGEDIVKAYQKVVGRIMKIVDNEKSLLELI